MKLRDDGDDHVAHGPHCGGDRRVPDDGCDAFCCGDGPRLK